MKIFADLHLHSHYSRATSGNMDIDNLERNAKIKGLNLLGTGDFTHPSWLSELKGKLKEHDGLFHFKDESIFFMLQAEVSNIYRQNEKSRRVHNILLAPSFDIVDQINDFLKDYGKLASDGRPILTKITCEEMAERLFKISKDIVIIPAHIWTPWFSVFGSMSGFDKIDECFGDQTKNIFAVETGLSSDPAMNWRLSQLDRFAFVSNSDSHSPWPSRIGRELNVLESEPSYDGVISAIKSKDPKRFLYTVEVDPAYGKYHWDGHRGHNIVMEPSESKKKNNLCPVCGKTMTIGVLHRVEELADREEGYTPKNPVPFKSILPLSELIAYVYATQPFSKKVWEESTKLTRRFGTELEVLLNAEETEMRTVIDDKIVKIIMFNREGKLKVSPGYDGVYGKLELDDSFSIKKQKTIKDF
jgi:uncharacterized protein (TIGR00375 family)